MNYSFYPLAVKELNHLIDYYEDINPGLGLEFLKENYSTIQRISNFQMLSQKYLKNVEDE